jgi:hypothetical protein
MTILGQVSSLSSAGAWRDYLFGGKTYIVPSLTSKALLAWLVFANTLVK